MRSRAVRLTISAVAFMALAAAAFFLFQSEKQIAERRQAVRAFDLRARDGVDRLADLRAAQQAYVAAGQGAGFWMPKVSGLAETAAAIVAHLRATARSPESQAALMETEAIIAEFVSVDRRAREYIASGEPLMAADVVFAEGSDAAMRASHRVEQARLAEHQAVDAFEAELRLQEAYVAGGAAGFAAVLLLLMAVAVPAAAGRPPVSSSAHASRAEAFAAFAAAGHIPVTGNQPRAATAAAAQPAARPAPRYELLKRAADLCTEFGRLNDASALPDLLARSADLMDASGLIVWVGDTAGGDLRPLAAHGYPPQALSRMPPVAKSADNAAAGAYRTGKLQIVMARPGVASGAIVAPLLSPMGCVGALTAEIKGGGETSDATQALAALIAAQLANVMAPSATEDELLEQKTG